jgi:hypothetical protein
MEIKRVETVVQTELRTTVRPLDLARSMTKAIAVATTTKRITSCVERSCGAISAAETAAMVVPLTVTR